MEHKVDLYGVEHNRENVEIVKRIIKLKLKPGTKVGVEIPPRYFKSADDFVQQASYGTHEFWTEIVRFLNEKKAVIVPLDIYYFELIGPKNKKHFVTGNDLIPRNIGMAKTIVSERVDVALVGYGHLAPIYKYLKKVKGVSVRGHQWKELNWVSYRSDRRKRYAESLQRIRKLAGSRKRVLRL